MGKIQAGILSPVSGKVAGVVGGRWKNKAYIRAYTVPANPNTAGQQVQRGKFKLCVDFAKLLVGQIFNPYTDKFQKTMSGFNFFIKRNIAYFADADPWEDLKMTEGVLSSPLPINMTLDAGVVEVTWTPNNGNNGLDTDQVMVVVWDKNLELIYFPVATVDRSEGSMEITVNDTVSINQLQTWTFASQSVAGVLKSISNSIHYED